MSLPRKFAISSNWLNFPKGVSPNDDEGVKFAERAIARLTGADHVEVTFDHSPSGQPLLDQMRVYTEFPRKEGRYISTAGIDSDVAKILGDLIEDLAEGGDASGNLSKLQEKVQGGGSPDEKPDKEEGDDKGSDGPPAPGGDEGPDSLMGPDSPSSSSPAGAGAPSNKPRVPFASRNDKRERQRRTSMLQRELGVDFKAARRIQNTVESSSSFPEAKKRLSKILVDENDRPLPHEDFVRIAKIARGENPLR